MQVTALASGGFVVNWGQGGEVNWEKVQGGLQFFDETLQPRSPRFLPDAAGMIDGYALRALELPDGTVAAFSVHRDLLDGRVVFHLSIHDSSGNLVTPAVALPDDFSRYAWQDESIVALPDGNLLLLHAENGALLGQVMSLDGKLDEHQLSFGRIDRPQALSISTTGVLHYLTKDFDLGPLDGLGAIHLARFALLGDAATSGPFTPGDDIRRLEAGGRFLTGAGDDRVVASDFATTLQGGLGDDLLLGGAGRDVLQGGAGNDTLQSQFDVSFYGKTTNQLYGGDGDDLLLVNGSQTQTVTERLFGGAGNDTIHDLTAYTVLGNRDSFGGAGNDVIRAAGNKYGGSGDDTLSGLGQMIDGGDGVDVVLMVYEDYDSDTGWPMGQPLIFDLQSDVLGDSNRVILKSIEVVRIIGTISGQMAGDAADNVFLSDIDMDTLSGRDGNDFLSSRGDNDVLYGGAGADSLYGGAGTDMLEGGAGADWIDRGAGFDTLVIVGAAGVRVDLGQSKGQGGVAGGDRYTGIEAVLGGRGDDTLIGGDGNDRLTGADGNDRLYGGRGNDTLLGSKGDDRIFGGGRFGPIAVRHQSRPDR